MILLFAVNFISKQDLWTLVKTLTVKVSRICCDTWCFVLWLRTHVIISWTDKQTTEGSFVNFNIYVCMYVSGGKM